MRSSPVFWVAVFVAVPAIAFMLVVLAAIFLPISN